MKRLELENARLSQEISVEDSAEEEIVISSKQISKIKSKRSELRSDSNLEYIDNHGSSVIIE